MTYTFSGFKEVDIKGIEEKGYLRALRNVFREDKPCLTSSEELVDLAPDKKDNFIKVKAVFEN